jgi:hypothetical protein
VASLFRSADGPLIQGLHDGATAAEIGVHHLLDRARGVALRGRPAVEGAPAFATA